MATGEKKKDLIKLVDSECKKKRFTPTAITRIVIQFGSFLIVIFLFLWLLVLIRDVINMLPKDIQTNLSLPFVAICFSFIGIAFSMLSNMKLDKSTIDEIIDWYYRKLLKTHCCIEPKDGPILKALIKMKCTGFDFSLSEIYQTKPSLFEDETLLKYLYKF